MRSPRLRRLQASLLVAGPLLFAAISLAIGKKTGWDFFNYHWYNPFALVNGRFGFDVAVAHHATYYNPIADLPLYWLVSSGPAWLGGVFMGAMAGIAVALIGVLANSVLPIADATRRTLAAATLALAGAFGAGAFQEIGDPANDIPAAIGILIAMIRCVRRIDRPDATFATGDARVFVIAGLLAGAAVALKLTIAVYAVGVGGALFLVSGSLATRFKRSALFSGGLAAGLLIVGGFWMWRLWRYSGNPFLPYFNGIFHSPLLLATSYQDPNFKPHGLLDTLLFPLHFTLESRNVSESIFRDAHILILYVVLPLALIIRRIARRDASIPSSVAFLFYFAAISYLAWLVLFDIYRYLIPLEMLAPLLIALAMASLPVQSTWKMAATVVLLVMAQVVVRIDVSDRQIWEGPYVSVTRPEIADADRTMVLMTGHAPMAYVIPFFPPSVPFVRIDSWLVQGSDRTTGFARMMRERVARHEGPLAVIFEEQETTDTEAALADYDLKLLAHPEKGACRRVSSNINVALWFCPVRKS